MEKKYRIGGEFKALKPSSPHAILAIAGYASTDAVDSYNEIVRPQAFYSSLSSYLQHPILLFGHDWYSKPVGKIVKAEITDKGLYIEAEIADTADGQDIKNLIEFGILKAFSIGFQLRQGGYVETANDQPNEIIDLELLEISVVNVPANREALIEQAKKSELQLKSISFPTGEGKRKGASKMPDIDVNKAVDEKMSPIITDVGEVKTAISELKSGLAEFAEFRKAFDNKKDLTDSELNERIDNMEDDVKKAIAKMDALHKLAKERQITYGKIDKIPFHSKQVHEMPTRELKSKLSQDAFARVRAFHEVADKLTLVDAILDHSSRVYGIANGVENYHQIPRAQRIKSLKVYEEFNEFRKAMDTGTAAEGTEWIPTDMSSTMGELVELELRVSPLFNEFQMPTAAYKWPIFTTATEAIKLTEQKTVITAYADSNEQTPGTSAITFTAVKLRGRIQISEEMNEDSAVAVMPFVMRELAKSMARAEDQGIVNGQLTADIDTGYGGLAATSAKKLFNGLRYQINAMTGATVDLSTFNEDGLRDIRACMTRGGPYGMYPDDLAILCSAKGYLKHFLKDLDSVLTVDKYGPNAVVLRGELMRFDGIPVIPTGYVQDDLNAAGIYDGTTTDKTQVITVYRPGFLKGIRRGIQVASEKNLAYDVWNLFSFKRMDFQPMFAAASNNIAAMGYGVST